MSDFTDLYDEYLDQAPMLRRRGACAHDSFDGATCRRCGKQDLTLVRVKDKWVLFEHIGLRLTEHTCDHLDLLESDDE